LNAYENLIFERACTYADRVPGTTAEEAALAGFIILSIALMLMIIFLGMGSAGISVSVSVAQNKTVPDRVEKVSPQPKSVEKVSPQPKSVDAPKGADNA
jgi:hypothetical protein